MRNKKIIALALLTALLLTSCKNEGSNIDKTEATGVTLTVSTMYAGNDSNTRKYKEAIAEWEAKTGNTIIDESTTSDDSYKKRIIMEFQSGAEPDVLFFFNGVDSNSLVENKRVVSLEEIREVYPDYASNMKEKMMPASPVDGKIYAIPVNGYWEGLFVNKKICEEVGVKVPDKDTDWTEFLSICEKIKKAGYIPIAASLSEIPHYWFEFCIYNHQNAITHSKVPSHPGSSEALAWVNGINDIKEMYEKGLFPSNTLSISDEQSTKLFLDEKAAFLLDGSWRVGALEDSENRDNFVVTFVPGTEQRSSTSIISGLSSGYYITRKAWEDPEKRDAAVNFVMYMTSDTMVSSFAEVTATALQNGVQLDRETLSPLIVSCLDMVEQATASSEAVQDYVPTEARGPIFNNMSGLVRGTKSINEAVAEVINNVKEADKEGE